MVQVFLSVIDLISNLVLDDKKGGFLVLTLCDDLKFEDSEPL